MILPTPEQSYVLINHGLIWASWIHCALNNAEFEREHNRFWEGWPLPDSLGRYSPSWLAIYFASLAVSEVSSDQSPSGYLELTSPATQASLLTLDVAEVDIFFKGIHTSVSSISAALAHPLTLSGR